MTVKMVPVVNVPVVVSTKVNDALALKKADVGVQFNYYGYRVPAYGNASSINFEIGILIHLTDKLSTGLHVYNPVGGKLG